MARTASARGSGLDPELVGEMEEIAASSGCELVHAEFKGGLLRLTLDREGGVTLEDCERVSKQVSALLDVVDFGRSRYTLEVGSPGLDRQLYGPRDYERFAGRRVRVTFRDPETAAKKTVSGRLEAYVPASAEDPARGGEIVVVDSTRGERYRLCLADVELARLEIEL